MNSEIVRHLDVGDCFGEISCFLYQPATASVFAKTYVELFKLGREVFRERIEPHFPNVARMLLGHVCEHAHEEYNQKVVFKKRRTVDSEETIEEMTRSIWQGLEMKLERKLEANAEQQRAPDLRDIEQRISDLERTTAQNTALLQQSNAMLEQLVAAQRPPGTPSMPPPMGVPRSTARRMFKPGPS